MEGVRFFNHSNLEYVRNQSTLTTHPRSHRSPVVQIVSGDSVTLAHSMFIDLDVISALSIEQSNVVMTDVEIASVTGAQLLSDTL